MSLEPENLFERYHAHVYFDEGSVAAAAELCVDAWRHCHIGLGRLHRKPVGPHPRWSCQLAFDAAQFDELIPWLDSNRNGLTILVHGRTGDDLADHTAHASWLGEPVELDLSIFQS